MTDIVVIGIVLVIVGIAATYIIKAKKSGAKCIGCPSGCRCSDKSGAHSGCSCR